MPFPFIMISQFMDAHNHIRDGIVTAGGKLVGLFVPSTIIGSDEKFIYINSKDGIASFETGDPEHFWKALVKSGSILFGSSKEVETCSSYLKDPQLSRTTSYFCTEASSCADLISKLQNVSSAEVVIIGCGGIGSMTAMNLAGAGVKNLTLVDHDTIEESNLNRQFFWTRRDIGLHKVDVLSRAIYERFSNLEIACLKSHQKTAELISLSDMHDACVVTADEPLGINAEIARASRTFVVSGAYFQGYSSYSAHHLTQNASSPQIKWARNPSFIAPSFGPANTEIAGAVSSACLNYLAIRNNNVSVEINHAWRSNRIAHQ